jgi:nitrite reductase/ring-hydroxylating ferredoxin subunit
MTSRVTWLRLAPAEALPCGGAVCVDANGTRVAVFHTRNGYHALAGQCNHMGGPLSRGNVTESTVTCPWHGWRYDLRTGARTDRPGQAVAAYPIENRQGWLFLGLPAEETR